MNMNEIHSQSFHRIVWKNLAEDIPYVRGEARTGAIQDMAYKSNIDPRLYWLALLRSPVKYLIPSFNLAFTSNANQMISDIFGQIYSSIIGFKQYTRYRTGLSEKIVTYCFQYLLRILAQLHESVPINRLQTFWKSSSGIQLEIGSVQKIFSCHEYCWLID